MLPDHFLIYFVIFCFINRKKLIDLFNKIKEIFTFGLKPKKKQITEKASAATNRGEVKYVAMELKETPNTEIDFHKKQKTEQMKQEIFDQINAVVEEHGGTSKWGADVEKLLPTAILRTFTNSVGIEFVSIPVGEFMMGSNEFEDEMPVHKVTIRNPFYLGKYPVTQKQWKAVMGSNPSNFKGSDLPVEQVSWNDAQEFFKKLNLIEGTDTYRFPSEAEWEYACRAGTATSYYFEDDESKLGDYAWYAINSDYKTHPVGQKKPNPWGLYDMRGNVWEWCQDDYHSDYNGAPSDGSAWESGSNFNRIRRGGSWSRKARCCRSMLRRNNDPSCRDKVLGFRVLMSL